MGSTIPLCRWPFPRLCGFSTTGRAGRFNSRYVLSSSFAFLQSLAQRCLAGRPQPASTSHGLSLPSAHQGSEVYLTRARPPATFRPQGLVTLSTVCSLRAPAGFVSHRRRSWDSPFGAFSSRKVPAAFPRWMNPHTVFPVGIPARRSGWAGPTSRGFRAFTLPGVPGSPAGVNSPTAGCSLGLSLPGCSGGLPGPGLRPCSSHALLRSLALRPATAGASESQSALRLALPTPSGKPDKTDRTTLIGFLHRHDPDRSSEPGSGLSSSPRAAPRVAADRPTLLRPNAPRSTSVARDRLRCRAFALNRLKNVSDLR
jgi:hypothetical protein